MEYISREICNTSRPAEVKPCEVLVAPPAIWPQLDVLAGVSPSHHMLQHCMRYAKQIFIQRTIAKTCTDCVARTARAVCTASEEQFQSPPCRF